MLQSLTNPLHVLLGTRCILAMQDGDGEVHLMNQGTSSRADREMHKSSRTKLFLSEGTEHNGEFHQRPYSNRVRSLLFCHRKPFPFALVECSYPEEHKMQPLLQSSIQADDGAARALNKLNRLQAVFMGLPSYAWLPQSRPLHSFRY